MTGEQEQELRAAIDRKWNGLELRGVARNYDVSPQFYRGSRVVYLRKATLLDRLVTALAEDPEKELRMRKQLKLLPQGEQITATWERESEPMKENPVPVPEAPKKSTNGKPSPDKALEALAAWISQVAGKSLDEEAVRRIVEAQLADFKGYSEPVKYEVKRIDGSIVKTGHTHKAFGDLLDCVSAGCTPFLVGGTGTGKSFAARQVADALGVPFYFQGACLTRYDLLGFVDANGRTVETPFSTAIVKPSVVLLDEVDAYSGEAQTALLASLENGHVEQPGRGEPLVRHKDCHVIAAGNTGGFGATGTYTARQRLDGAFGDRFSPYIVWDIDEDLERAFTGNNEAVDRVQELRGKAKRNGLSMPISPRASLAVARLMAAGWDLDKAIAHVIFNRLSEQDRQSLGG